MQTSSTIRKIRKDELSGLLSLYCHLHPNEPELAVTTEVERLWQKILADSQLHYLVAEAAGQLVSSCTLAIITAVQNSVSWTGEAPDLLVNLG